MRYSTIASMNYCTVLLLIIYFICLKCKSSYTMILFKFKNLKIKLKKCLLLLLFMSQSHRHQYDKINRIDLIDLLSIWA